jgi:hypothetical protein
MYIPRLIAIIVKLTTFFLRVAILILTYPLLIILAAFCKSYISL